MKKGFTIVEIIISISIILIVGISTTFFITNKNHDKLETTTKLILEAANLYVKTEKDKNGNIYVNEIVSGAKGVQIPLSNLVSSGYIKEEHADIIYENNDELIDNKDYYIMFIENIENYCDDGSYVTVASWIDKGDNIYLCDSYNKSYSDKSLIESVIFDYGSADKIEELSYVDENDYQCYGTDYFRTYCYSKQNGLFKRINNSIEEYYFRGKIANNYVLLGNDLFRILSFNIKEKEVKLIKETHIDSNIYFESTGTMNLSDFGNSVLYNSLFNWLHLYFPVYYNNKNLFKKSNYCLNMYDGYLYETPIKIEFPCNGQEITSIDGVGLISVNDALFSGIFPIDSVNSSYIMVTDTWLNSGSSTLMMAFNDQRQFTVDNCLREDNGDASVCNNFVFSANNLGVIGYFSIENYGYEFYDKIIASGIRPVIVIDDNYAKVRGKGTLSSPYELILE